MFKRMPVLDIQNKNFNKDERRIFIDYYESLNGSYIMTNIIELSDNFLDYYYEYDENTIDIVKSVISKIKDAIKEQSIKDDEDFVILIWW